MIAQSPALLAREQQILARYTNSLARVIADDTRATADDPRPAVTAAALLGIHRALIEHVRRHILAGEQDLPRLARSTRTAGKKALALLEQGPRRLRREAVGTAAETHRAGEGLAAALHLNPEPRR